MLFALLGVLATVALAQQSGKDPVLDVCRRHLHQTCVIDSRLYIDGGLAYYGGSIDNNSIAESNNYLLWEDLSNATMTKYNFSEQHANLSKGPEVPSVSGGVLWPDDANKLFYLFGGEYANTEEVKNRDEQGFTLWLYDTLYDTWNQSKYHASQEAVRWPAFGAGTVSDVGIAYYYGGYLSNTSDYGTDGQRVMQNSLITYDMDGGRWDNNTWDNTRRAEGSLIYLPASEGGMLLYFGGLETDETNGEVGYANMSQIHLFDNANSKWYTQTATGDVPRPRYGFCAGAAWAKDKSSYNIYLFGGFGTPNGTGLGDLYVLSLPSFQWILIWPTPQEFVFPGGKGWSSCNVFRESHMLVIGGYLTNTSVPDCDVEKIGGQHGLLLGQENVEQGDGKDSAWWHAPMDNITGYRVPDQIVARIGGDTDGQATRTAPDLGWATPDLAKYLGTTFAAQSRSATRAIPTTSAEPTSTSTPSKNTNVGAIAGGAVGGVVVLISIIALVVFCLRRRRQNTTGQAQGNATGTPDPSSPNVTQKSIADVSVSHGSTLHPPLPQSPAYSSKGSPPPRANPWHGEVPSGNSYYYGSPVSHNSSGDWTHHMNSAYQQTYYPPPPDPSQSPKESSAHTMSVELPSVRSPVNAEMPHIHSPGAIPAAR